MLRSLLSLFLLFMMGSAAAQVACTYATKPPPPPEKAQAVEMYGVTETQPLLLTRGANYADSLTYLNSSQQNLLRFVYSNLRYPPQAHDASVGGTVVVCFTIGTDGLIDPASIRCVRDIGAGCGKEAERIVQLMVDLGFRWVPATQRGRVVPVQFNLPLKFRLE